MSSSFFLFCPPGFRAQTEGVGHSPGSASQFQLSDRLPATVSSNGGYSSFAWLTPTRDPRSEGRAQAKREQVGPGCSDLIALRMSWSLKKAGAELK